LFKKFPYDARQAIAKKYVATCDEFDDIQIAGAKRRNGKDILRNKLQEGQ
jgi:hypothetical protein